MTTYTVKLDDSVRNAADVVREIDAAFASWPELNGATYELIEGEDFCCIEGGDAITAAQLFSIIQHAE